MLGSVNYNKYKKHTLFSLLLLALFVSLTYAWDAVWHGTDWIYSGQIIESKRIAENFEYLYNELEQLKVNSSTVNYVIDRSDVYNKDAVHYCPPDYPRLISCRVVDDQAPPVAPTVLAGYCDENGYCYAGGGAPAQYLRTNLGGENIYMETVINSSNIQGCWVYDPEHSHRPFRIEITCIQ